MKSSKGIAFPHFFYCFCRIKHKLDSAPNNNYCCVLPRNNRQHTATPAHHTTAKKNTHMCLPCCPRKLDRVHLHRNHASLLLHHSHQLLLGCPGWQAMDHQRPLLSVRPSRLIGLPPPLRSAAFAFPRGALAAIRVFALTATLLGTRNWRQGPTAVF